MKDKIWGMASVGTLVAVLFVSGLSFAGSLEPAGPPGPTMHTLTEICQKLEAMDSKLDGSDSGEGSTAVPKTGQTTSYSTGDDGDLQKGSAWPDPRFTDHGNDTVTDNLTGLMWVKAPHALDGNAEGQRWNDAIDYCNSLTYASHSDWRLPNVRELQSLIDYGRNSPALPSGHPFTGVQSSGYWSSTTIADYTDDAWFVYLGFGFVHSSSKTLTNYVWPVRAGE
jgi:hypothetical protein